MENLEIMNMIISVSILFTIATSFLQGMKCKIDDVGPGDVLWGMVKTIGYGTLAICIYKYTDSNKSIDAVTYFTYMLACFETGQNFTNSIGHKIIVIIKFYFTSSK